MQIRPLRGYSPAGHKGIFPEKIAEKVNDYLSSLFLTEFFFTEWQNGAHTAIPPLCFVKKGRVGARDAIASEYDNSSFQPLVKSWPFQSFWDPMGAGSLSGC